MLDMTFNLSVTKAATWTTSLNNSNGARLLWSKVIPPTGPPVSGTVQTASGFPGIGLVGVSSSLSDASGNVLCEWATVNTGASGAPAVSSSTVK